MLTDHMFRVFYDFISLNDIIRLRFLNSQGIFLTQNYFRNNIDPINIGTVF